MGRYERHAGDLPPGQRLQRGWPVTHYGPVPRFKPDRWEFRVFGATSDGDKTTWNHSEFSALPYSTVVADFHCVTKFSMQDVEWGGVATSTVAKLAPPADDVTHVMVWAEYGFSSNLRIEDFLDGQSIFATRRAGEPLTAEHGFPVRLIVPRLYAWKGPKWVRGVEYMTADRRGFWEERGYHNIGDPWREQRYSYQEEPGDGPEL
jgi:DMSO/TMAO reductase YedYZ molybdopterin-dependent catalytic subunit